MCERGYVVAATVVSEARGWLSIVGGAARCIAALRSCVVRGGGRTPDDRRCLALAFVFGGVRVASVGRALCAPAVGAHARPLRLRIAWAIRAAPRAARRRLSARRPPRRSVRRFAPTRMLRRR